MELDAKEKAAFLRDFGHRVERLIYDKCGSKEQFMRETGFYKKSLHDILTGARDTHLTTSLKLAKALGIPVKELFEWKNAKTST